MKTYTGSCQCGAVSFEVTSDPIEKVLSCNCSRCGRLGSLLHFVPAAHFTLRSGEDNLTEYRFNKKQIQHLFCRTCGIQSFSRGIGPDGAETVALNVRCLEGIEPETLSVTAFDGRGY